MSDSGYPDDIHQFDNEPRSPFYDDSNHEAFVDSRKQELLDDVSELGGVEVDAIDEIVIDSWGKGKAGDKAGLLTSLDNYFGDLADKQAEKEWGEK